MRVHSATFLSYFRLLGSLRYEATNSLLKLKWVRDSIQPLYRDSRRSETKKRFLEVRVGSKWEKAYYKRQESKDETQCY